MKYTVKDAIKSKHSQILSITRKDTENKLDSYLQLELKNKF